MTSHLVTIGGGGYYGPHGGQNRMLSHVLKLTKKKYPKICLIPTASSPKESAIQNFLTVMNGYGVHPNYLDFYKTPTNDLEDWLMDFDAVFIAGGNTRNLLAIWKAWDFDKSLMNAWKNGVVMSGSSAGAICWYEQGNSDYISGELNPIDGLGLIKGSVCPHYSNTHDRRQSYLDMIKSDQLKDGYGLSDRAGIHYINGEFHEALIEWDEAGVYKIEKDSSGQVIETKVKSRIV